MSARLNSSGHIYAPATDGLGTTIATRRASNEQEIYRDGVSIDTETDASTGVPDVNLYAWRGVMQGSIVFVIETHITDSQAESINTACENYMDYIGKGVQ